MDKKMLRRQIQQQRRSLTPAQIEAASEQLAQQFLAHPLYKQAQSVYGYLSYQSEVSTWSLLRRIQRDGKRVAVPRVVGQEMVFHWLDDLDQAQSGYHGIPEPLQAIREAQAAGRVRPHTSGMSHICSHRL